MMTHALHGVMDLSMRYLAHSAYQTPLLAAAAWLADRVLRKAGPQLQYRLWVGTLLMCAGLPLLPAAPLMRLAWPSNAHDFTTTAATLTPSAADASPHLLTVSAAAGRALSLAYLAACILGLLRLAARWRSTRRMALRSTVRALNPSAGMQVAQAARSFGIAAPLVRCSADLAGPVTLGLRRSLLIVPNGFFATERADDIAAALAHECAHIARRDFAKNLLYELVAIMVTYHPAIWWVRRRIAETRELACDELAAGGAAERPRYAASLLRLAAAMAGRTTAISLNAIGVFDANILEERIMQLTSAKPSVSKAKRMAMTAVAAGLLLSGGMTAMATGFDVSPQATEKVYKVGEEVSAPRLVSSVDAIFPKGRKGKSQFEGISVIGLTVDSKGMPQGIHVTRSLAPDFDKCATDAVHQYRFDPAMRDGKPVAVAIAIEVNFRRY